MLRANTFDVILKVDYSESTDVVRTDFSLKYEKSDQILVDEGYVEARSIPGRPGWTRHTGQKTLKFTSGLLNILAPAMTAMFLESKADWLESALPAGERTVRPAVS